MNPVELDELWFEQLHNRRNAIAFEYRSDPLHSHSSSFDADISRVPFSFSLSLVVESLTGLPRADRRLSRFCARLTAVCAEPATRLAVLTVPHKARHDRCVPRVIVITRVVLIPREVIDTINKSAGTYRLARSHVDQAGGRMGLDYRAQ